MCIGMPMMCVGWGRVEWGGCERVGNCNAFLGPCVTHWVHVET